MVTTLILILGGVLLAPWLRYTSPWYEEGSAENKKGECHTARRRCWSRIDAPSLFNLGSGWSGVDSHRTKVAARKKREMGDMEVATKPWHWKYEAAFHDNEFDDTVAPSLTTGVVLGRALLLSQIRW